MDILEPTHARMTAILQSQQALVKTLQVLTAGIDTYALVDFPDHSNVGDSAIYVGERTLLQELCGGPPHYVSAIKSHNSLDMQTGKNKPLIFLHGGGNFGDVWPKHQEFRESIIRAHPDCKIVQLPQSIHFHDVAGRDACARVIDAHPDFTLLVRDKESFALATTHFDCNVQMCPDSALYIGPLERTAPVTEDLLSIIRTDSESRFVKDEYRELQHLGPIEDWIIDTPKMKSKIDRRIQKLSIKSRTASRLLRAHRIGIYDKWAEERVARGIRQLSRAKFILTDRLHVHILSTLLGIPHVVLDNNYGKISRYMNAWHDTGTAQVVDVLQDAIEIARSHVASSK